MLFPEHKRNIYNKTTLQNVSIEFRYSPLLKIDIDSPAQFQEIIMRVFPRMEEKIQRNHFLDLNLQVINPDVPISAQSTLSTAKIWVFKTTDGKTSTSLTKNSLVISTTDYDCWENFQEKIKISLVALNTCYPEISFTRLGLRYINVFSKKNLGIPLRKTWGRLINPVFLGLLATPYRDHTIGYQNIQDIDYKENNAKARIVSSAVNSPDDMKSQSIMLDSDFYMNGAIERNEIWDKANYLHEQSRSLIEYVIKDDLREVMGIKK